MIAVIMGATGSGKSRIALETARRFNGEIVSFDSMQIYRGLEIGTAQPTAAERTEIPHHLVGIRDIAERIDVFDFLRLAEEAVAGILSRGKLPVIAGGTGFYLKAFLYGLDDIPGDPELRRKLNEQYDFPAAEPALAERLGSVDPEAQRRFADCRRRMIRALEVFLLTGKSILELQTNTRRPLREGVRAFKLELPAEKLDVRLKARAEQMIADGWIEEARAALERGLLRTPTAHQALGYPIIAEFLSGAFPEKELIPRIVTATRQYARRQRTWFRHQHPEAVLLDASAEVLPLSH